MIPFVRDMTFEYGLADQVSPLIQRVIADNPGPFTFRGTGTYIVGRPGGTDVAVIDPGPALDAHLQAILTAVGERTVAAILTTHTHIDHSPLARPLQAATGSRVLGRRDPGAPSGFEEENEARFVPDEEIADGARVAGDGWTLEAIATPGHASNHVAYALLEENALFSGDHVMGWSTTVVSPPDGDMGDYYDSLAKVEARGFATLWPTHGPPVTQVAPFLAAYREHRLRREAQIIRQIEAGKTTIRAMVPAMYAAVDPRLHPAAAHSVWAHLIHMRKTGVVATEGEAGLESDYRLV